MMGPCLVVMTPILDTIPGEPQISFGFDRRPSDFDSLYQGNSSSGRPRRKTTGG